MSHRYWEAASIASRYAKYRPVPPNGLIGRILEFLKEKYNGPLNLAVDVGCGSGQSTHLLAPHFTAVVGTDLSGAQIEQANQQNKSANVTFKVSPAETIPADDKSVQLISASQAAHWFDLPKFYEEGRRVLCPGGVLCLLGYELPRFVWTKDPSKEEALNAALMDFYIGDLAHSTLTESTEVYLGRYTLPKYKISFATEIVRFIKELCKDVGRMKREKLLIAVMPHTLSLIPTLQDESFYHDIPTSVEDMVMLTTTWSGFNNFCQKHGEAEGEKLLVKYRNRLMEILQVPTTPEETIFTKRTSFFLLMGRNP